MTYKLTVQPHVDKTFKKIAKRDPPQHEAIEKKVDQILENPYRFKPLSGKMKNKRRAHIYSSFVLVYEIHEPEHEVELLDYDHHDNIYW